VLFFNVLKYNVFIFGLGIATYCYNLCNKVNLVNKHIKYGLVNIVGGFLTLVGAIFIVLPGPAFLFLPIGLAILSLEHAWAKVWLRRCQRLMRNGAVKFDGMIRQLKYKLSKR